MHFGVFTYGSRGDVQPFVALSLGLIEQGHQVSLYAPENFKEFVESYGVNFYPLHGNVDQLMYSPESRRILKTGNIFSLMRHLQKEGKEIQRLVNIDLLAGCENVEVMISNFVCSVWINCIAEKLNKKWGLITLTPPTTPTKEFPFAGLAFFNNAVYNQFSHRLIEFMYWQFNKKGINKFRQALSLPLLKKNILNTITAKNILNLYAISPSLIARPKDWCSNSDITGYMVLDFKVNEKNSEEEIPEGLTEWLSKGVKPIYVGLGSMPVPDPELLKNILSEILHTTDDRILFCKGWSQVEELPPHPNLFVINSADFKWLLPQCDVAVIHGGAGTIAAVLRAKIPIVITSVFGDQPWWGSMIQNKKLGIHLPFKKLTTKLLLEAVSKVRSTEIRKNAFEIGEKMSRENGVKTAIEAINKYFSVRRGSCP